MEGFVSVPEITTMVWWCTVFQNVFLLVCIAPAFGWCQGTAYKALLGTPNGVGVTYLLWTHTAQRWVKTVTQIKIFTRDSPKANGDGWFMVFYVGAPTTNM